MKIKTTMLLILLSSFAVLAIDGNKKTKSDPDKVVENEDEKTEKSLPKTKVSGYQVSDYYWVAKNHNEELKDKHGFWFRRIYLTFDYKYDNNFSSRLRFEMNSPGDFDTKAKMNTIVKDAYLKYSNSGHSYIVGMSSTPTWGVVEKIWGYRAVEKTFLDLQKFGSSRDVGFAVKGKIDKSGLFKYHVMYGNGASNNSEINKGKKFLGSISFYPTNEIVIEVYGDYSDNAGENDHFTAQGFISYKTKKFNVALQYFHQRQKFANEEEHAYDGLSAWVTTQFSKKWSAYARMDKMFQPNPNGEKIAYLPFDSMAKSTLFILGAAFEPVSNVKVMPNVEIVLYDENDQGITPGSDVIPRMSFYYVF